MREIENSNRPLQHQQSSMLGNEDVSTQLKINNQLTTVVKRWQKKFLIQQLLLFIPLLLSTACVAFLIACFLGDIKPSNATNFAESDAKLALFLGSFIAVLIALISKVFFITRSQAYKSITLPNLLFHLNRQYAELEESSQLLLGDYRELSMLERLQFEKVCSRISAILAQQHKRNYIELSPIFAQRQFIKSVVILLGFIVFSAVLSQSTLLRANDFDFETSLNKIKESKNKATVKSDIIKLVSKQIIVEPPAYSLANPANRFQQSESLNIKALTGSKVTWSFKFSNANKDYYLNFSNGEQHKLTKMLDGSFQFKQILTASMVYHLSVTGNELPLAEVFSSVYSIKLKADEPPIIRFITPKITVTEFTEKAKPILVSEVQITDDFTITEVEILASIAKGSGEGVKFRDQSFEFDRIEVIDGKTHYYKTWRLTELDMEPGDELYFSVIAKDNRTPQQQTTRSSTKIVRWLEEGQLGVNVDGILIDFMPEYFKSQRQIIIETIELIEDKTDLTLDKFNDTSEILGVAQSALKEKYGQYLGDEFEGQQNVGVTFDGDHGSVEHDSDEHSSSEQSTEKHQKPTVQVHDDHGGSSAVITAAELGANNVAIAHRHESSNKNHTGDISGKAAIINRYGHNHEDSDIGVMSSQDPKALMKKSLENMWQAELHLMLSQPELALPFEQKALKLLKRAKKAERIYVKRLGFEPPPVTEKRRYQGEENDILANQVQQSRFLPEQLSNQTQWAFKSLLQMLNMHVQTEYSAKSQAKQKATSHQNEYSQLGEKLNSETLVIVKSVKQELEKQIVKRPALVGTLATVERILLKQSLTLNHCQDCLIKLAAKITQLIPEATAVPIHQIQNVADEEPILESYNHFLKGSL
jgi:hypothetical protein